MVVLAAGYGVSRSETLKAIGRALAHRAARAVLWTPWRAAGTLLAVVAVVVLIGKLNRPTPHGAATRQISAVPADAATTPEATASTPGRQVPAPRTTTSVTVNPATSTPAARPDPKMLAAAAAFAHAWVRYQLPAARWYAGVAPYATPALRPLLRLTDPRNVPASRVTGPPRVVNTADGYVSVLVPTDRAPVALTLTRTGTAWLISAV